MTRPTGLAAVGPLGYTMLLCREIAPMRAFYGDVLGLPIRREVADRYVEFGAGSVTLALRLRSRPYDGQPPEQPTASVQLAFVVAPDDVDAAADQLVALGIEPLEPVRDLPDFGHRVLFVHDPEHNIVELYGALGDAGQVDGTGDVDGTGEVDSIGEVGEIRDADDAGFEH